MFGRLIGVWHGHDIGDFFTARDQEQTFPMHIPEGRPAHRESLETFGLSDERRLPNVPDQFGKVLNQLDPRQIQFALKLTF